MLGQKDEEILKRFHMPSSLLGAYGITEGNWLRNQFTYGVIDAQYLPPGTGGPVATGGSPRGLATSPPDWLDLAGPGATSSDLTPTLSWDFDIPDAEIREVNLFVSTLPEGEGLLPWDQVVNLSDSSVLAGRSEQEKRKLLTKAWNGYDDLNPNRILTATWNQASGKWTWHDRTIPIVQPTSDSQNTGTQFTLPDERTLTVGQTYYWAVEAQSTDGRRNIDFGQFKTSSPPFVTSSKTFSSVTVLTHGFEAFSQVVERGIPSSIYDMADSIARAGGEGLILRYNREEGDWTPVNKYGQKQTIQDLSTYYGKPLVLLPDWAQNLESVLPNSGFSEAAADAFFASLVQLDQSGGQSWRVQ
jgi:hypothetical protein